MFIGDTPEDRLAAEAVGVPFLGRDSGKDIGGAVKVYSNLLDIKKDIA